MGKPTPTPGPFVPWSQNSTTHNPEGAWFIANLRHVYADKSPGFSENDARVIAEALNVQAETGLTPRQLADQRAELLAALKEARPYVTGGISSQAGHICGPESNCDCICEGNARAGNLISSIDHLIAKTEGEKP